MLQKPTPFVVKADSPWADDKLDRKKVADYLTPVLASVTQPFVIGLDSPYGTGKSFFLKNWQCDLEQQGFHTVYFNAWETDFSQNALFAFMTAIKRELEQRTPESKKDTLGEKFSQFAKRAAGFMRHDALNIVAKEVARRTVGDNIVKDAISSWNKPTKDNEITNLAQILTHEGMKSQEAAEASIQNFKEYLTNLIQELTLDSEIEKKKLIIFVDELDRCRPDYAVQILECIKHLFAVDGMLFVLAIDEAQVRNAIHSVYGPNLDSDGYLRRFIDWRYRLPKPSALNFCKFLLERFELKNQDSSYNGKTFYDVAELSKSLGIFSQAFGLSLREIEQCYTEANLYLRTLQSNECPFPMILGVFLVARLKFPLQLKNALQNISALEELLAYIEAAMEHTNLKGYHSWRNLRTIIHSWFLNEEYSNQIRAKIDALFRISNNQNIDIDSRKKSEAEVESLSSALKYYNDINAIFRYSFESESLAEFVYSKLNTTEAYTLG